MAPSKTEDAAQTNVPLTTQSGVRPESQPAQAWSPMGVIENLPIHEQPTAHTNSPVSFFHMLHRLKTTKREGWRRFGINHGESISDHMYRMSILTMLAPKSLSSRLDVPHCTRMALIHDMAELLVGDITPVDGVAKPEKSRRESETMDYLCRNLLGGVDGGDAGVEIKKVWQEYEDSETLESKFVHDVDKMELILQMVEYERQHEGRLNLQEFSWVAGRIVLPEVQAWCQEVLREREAFWTSLGRATKGDGMTEEGEKQRVEYYGKSKEEDGDAQ